MAGEVRFRLSDNRKFQKCFTASGGCCPSFKISFPRGQDCPPLWPFLVPFACPLSLSRDIVFAGAERGHAFLVYRHRVTVCRSNAAIPSSSSVVFFPRRQVSDDRFLEFYTFTRGPIIGATGYLESNIWVAKATKRFVLGQYF